MIYPIYAFSYGDLMCKVLNAVVAIIGSSTFATCLRLGVLLSIFATVIGYIQRKTPTQMLKFLATYMAIASGFLGLKMFVEIIDPMDIGAVHTVAHVPVGLGYVLSVSSQISHALQTEFEKAMSLPDDQAYSKTGFLFGSKLYMMSTAARVQSPVVQSDVNQYFKNCVIGDIYINHKYSMDDLKNSTNIWERISKNPSPIRGVIFQNRAFMTCKEATPVLKKLIDEDIQKRTLPSLAQKIFGKSTVLTKGKINTYLPQAYQYYSNISQTAAQILTQNVMISAIRQGAQNYASETGAVAAMMNYETEKSLHAQNLTWHISKNMAGYTLPIMNALMTVLSVGVFPFIALLAISPTWVKKIFPNYYLTFIWLSTWPLLNSVANLMVTSRIHSKVAGIAAGGLTLSNADPVALLHSYQAGMAGYIMTLIPFLSWGFFRGGLGFAFNNAANYIGGIAHQRAAAAGEEAATGNISLGNMSMNNVNANKWDTNSTYMHGQATQQMKNGATVSTMADGSTVLNGLPAISQLGTQIHGRHDISESLSNQANDALQSANRHQHNFDHSASSFASQVMNYSEHTGHQTKIGQGFSNNEVASVDHAMNNLRKIAHDVSSRTGATESEVLRKMTEGSIGGSLGASAKAGNGWASVSAGLNAGIQKQRTKTHASESTNSNDFTLSAGETQSAVKDFKALSSYTKNHHTETDDNTGIQTSNQWAADYREAQNEQQSWSVDMQRSRSFTQAASFAQTNSAYSDENLTQSFANYVKDQVGQTQATWILTNQTQYARQVCKAYEDRFLSQQEAQLKDQFKTNATPMAVQPFYDQSSKQLNTTNQSPNADFKKNSTNIKTKAIQHGLDSNTVNQKARELRGNVNAQYLDIKRKLNSQTKVVDAKKQARENQINENVKREQNNANQGFWKGVLLKDKKEELMDVE